MAAPATSLYQLQPLDADEVAMIALFAKTTIEQVDQDPKLKEQIGYDTANSLAAKTATAAEIPPAGGDARQLRCSRCKQVISIIDPEKLTQKQVDDAKLTCVKCVRRLSELTGAPLPKGL